MPSTAYEFLLERQDRLAEALVRNRDVAEFVQAVLEHLIDRADTRGEPHMGSVEIISDGSRYLVSVRLR